MKSKANQFIKVRAEMRRTFFLFRSSSPLLLPDDPTRPTIKQHHSQRPTIKQHPAHARPSSSHRHANHQAAPRHTTTTPHHANVEGGEPPHALTLTTSTDRHTLDRFMASEGALSTRLERLTPCAAHPLCPAGRPRPSLGVLSILR